MASNKVKGGPSYRRIFYALLLSNTLSAVLFLLRMLESGSANYWYLNWNLVLAWLPLGFAWWLVVRLRRGLGWKDTFNALLTVLWLGFLPNSFYLLTDFIHLEATGEVGLLYDVVLLFSFTFNAYVVGLISMYLIHTELLKRLSRQKAHLVIGAVLLACSFAIYLGRSLRWNTWDVLINPAGLLFDVSDRVINPAAHPQAVVTTVTFFVLLGSIYVVAWEIARALRNDNR